MDATITKADVRKAEFLRRVDPQYGWSEYIPLRCAEASERATLRVFTTRAAFEQHCAMHARDLKGADVLVRGYHNIVEN